MTGHLFPTKSKFPYAEKRQHTDFIKIFLSRLTLLFVQERRFYHGTMPRCEMGEYIYTNSNPRQCLFSFTQVRRTDPKVTFKAQFA